MIKYKFIDHTADIAVEVYGDSLEALFENAAEAWLKTVTGKSKIESKEKKIVVLEDITAEALLVNFLNEINYLLLTGKWIFNRIKKITFKKSKNLFQLYSEISGEEYSPGKHKLKEEIKAVTFHQIKIRREGNLYRTKIIFDI